MSSWQQTRKIRTRTADSISKGFALTLGGVRDVAQLYIDALYELDRYVSRLRNKDFE